MLETSPSGTSCRTVEEKSMKGYDPNHPAYQVFNQLAVIDSGLLLKPGIQHVLTECLIEDSGLIIENMLINSKTGWIIKLYGSGQIYHITVKQIIDGFYGKINETFTGEIVDKFIEHLRNL